jgi:RsmE family RNA methyltransferase
VNLLLLRPEELDSSGLARLTGRRLLHAREVLGAREGETLKVGLLGGQRGTAEIVSLDAAALVLRPSLCEPPPARAGVELLLALPRPKALKKILPAAASFGVSRIFLVNAARVEKSFFASPLLAPAALEALCCLGLEQARDTLLPEVRVVERLKPFVEDELDGLLGPGPLRLLAHPGARGIGEVLEADRAPPLEPDPTQPDLTLSATAPEAAATGQSTPTGKRPIVLAIGPDGGWVPFERELLGKCGFVEASLGERPLRTEVAVSALLGAILAAAHGSARRAVQA